MLPAYPTKGRSMSKQVAKAKTTAVSAADEFEDMAGEGLENVTAGDLTIPRVDILQQMSPSVQKGGSEYVEGFEPGKIAESATQKVFDEITFLPCLVRHVWIEWGPVRNQAPVAVHEQPTEPSSQQNTIQETYQFFGLLMRGGDWPMRVTLPMKSTQIKRAKQILTQASSEMVKASSGRTFTPPLYYRVLHMGVVAEEKPPHRWYGWKVKRGETINEWCQANDFDWPVLKKFIQDFRDDLSAERVKADYGEGTAAPTQTDRPAGGIDDEIPF